VKEEATQPIRIDDMEPAILEAFLHFVYTDAISESCKRRWKCSDATPAGCRGSIWIG
jgi:hypothetical protein